MSERKSYIILGISILIALCSVSYAWFSTILKGNDESKKNTIETGNLSLTYTDTSEMSIDNAIPGDSFEKIIVVKNTGTLNTKYNLVWQELTNEIINNELVIEATCKRFNSSNIEEGTCKDIQEVPINSLVINSGILIEPNIVHKYALKITFKDTGLLQNYNKSKRFSGKLGIEEFKSTPFREESWSTIAANVKAGNVSGYNVGDTREIDLGNYGIHKVRISNLSTPSECGTDGFSQTACGFVVEFENIIMLSEINTINTNKGGWPSSKLYKMLNTDLYNALSSDLKNSITNTTVVSGHENGTSVNYTSIDKFYLLSGAEIYNNWSSTSDTGKDLTRQLDYYASKNVSLANHSDNIKKYRNAITSWWLRVATSRDSSSFLFLNTTGGWDGISVTSNYGVSPAFRIG